jgi:hypothetical protein
VITAEFGRVYVLVLMVNTRSLSLGVRSDLKPFLHVVFSGDVRTYGVVEVGLERGLRPEMR